jgi:hypothetical protein
MLGVGLLVRLGRSLLAGPLADSGLLPAGYYRHLALGALEEEDFPRALTYLRWAQDRVLTQVVILRLRLLTARHRKERRALLELLAKEPLPERQEKIVALLAQQDRALGLLGKYEEEGLEVLGGGPGERGSPALPSNTPPHPL